MRWGDLAKQGCAVVIHGGQYGLNNNDGTPAERGSDGDYPEIDATIHEGTHTNTKKVQRDGQIRVSAAGTEGYPYIKFDNVKRVQIDGGRWRGEGGGLAVRDVVQGRRRGRAPLASETDLVGADLGQLPNRTSVARKGGPEAGDRRAGPAAEEPREISEAKEATAPAVLMRLAHDPELDQSEQVRSVQPAVGGEHKGDGQQLKRKATSGAAGRRKHKERRTAEEAKREASALAVAQRELLEASEKLAKERQQREQQQRETDATQLQLRERAEEQLKMERQQRKRAEQQLQTEQELRERVRELEKHLAEGEQREPQPWKQAERHGQHTVVFASGARYEGCWEADKRHGAENQARELEQHLTVDHHSLYSAVCIVQSMVGSMVVNRAVDLLIAYMYNIANAPAEAKCRTVYTSNKFFAERVGGGEEGRQLMTACGWAYVYDGDDTAYVYDILDRSIVDHLLSMQQRSTAKKTQTQAGQRAWPEGNLEYWYNSHRELV